MVAGSECVDLNGMEASECEHALLGGYVGPCSWGSVGLEEEEEEEKEEEKEEEEEEEEDGWMEQRRLRLKVTCKAPTRAVRIVLMRCAIPANSSVHIAYLIFARKKT